MSKNILTMLLGNLPKPEHSYNSTQGHIQAAMLKEVGIEVEIPYTNDIPEINEDDTIFMYLGFGYSPDSTDINVFGGMKNCGDFICEHLTWLSNHKGKVISLGYPLPDYGTIIGNKLKGLTPEQLERWKGLNLDGFKRFADDGMWIEYPNSNVAKNMVIGDSHAYSLYRPGYMVNSVPHKTLFGALKEGFKSFLPDANINSLDIMFGNIDVRHHLCRQSSPIEAAAHLATQTFLEMQQLPYNEINFYELLPIENESRKLSKSGWYRGTPFFGSWELRSKVRDSFNYAMAELCKNSDEISFIRWTDGYLNEKGELDFRFMEKPRGVHLSGAHFPFWKRNETNSMDVLFG
jgi:hypothetical protein